MTVDELYRELNYVDASRSKRTYYSNLVLSKPELLENLLEIVFMVHDQVSIKASWILEFVCNKKLDLLFPYLDTFLEKINTVKFESAIRPIAKICEILVVRNYNSAKITRVQFLNETHKKLITEVCFNYLIQEHKVAPKAYSMNTLALLSKDFDWIKKELRLVLEKEYSTQSKGYQARARKVLIKLD